MTKKEYWCKKCKKMIIKDINKYLEDYPKENYIQCCYCFRFIFVKDIKKEVKITNGE